MKNINRQKIRIMLEKMEETAKINYSNFEIALLLFLRSDIYEFDNISDQDLKELSDLIEEYDSILDIDKEDIDNIIYGEEEEE